MASTISFGNANAGFQQVGIINGPVNNAFHLPPERRETPPPPSIVIPFPRDADFIERGTTLDQVSQRCAAPGSRTALVGLGGVGKSQLAIEYAYRTREQSPETWVFWVHASNAARFEQSFYKIADRVMIAGRQDPQVNIFKLVHDWLCSSKHQWLLVLDNVDDAHFLVRRPASDSNRGAQPLREYVPHCHQGSVLITTRNRQAAGMLVEQRDIIEVNPMDEHSALALLEKKLGTQADHSKIAKLAVALEYMPLAIVQAAAYISQRAPRYSVARYLDDYKKSEQKQTSLLKYDDGQLRRDWEATNSIIVTWQISFEYIHQTRPSAADLLSLMSFFDRQGIPEGLLRHRGKQGLDDSDQQAPTTRGAHSDVDEDDASQSSMSIKSGEDTFEDDVVALRNFCFISDETGGTSFEMHALVQLAARTWLAANGELERWKQQFVRNLSAAFPTGEYQNWAVCQTLYAHAKAAVEQQPKDESSLARWAKMLYCAAWYAESIGNIADTEMLAIKAMKALKKVLGEEHEDTLWSVAMVGDAFSLGGQWDKAETLRRQVMEVRKKKLGPDDPSTLTSMSNLAMTYWNQGRWDAAEELELQVLETRKKKLGADHLYTLTSMANLAVTYYTQGRWDAAEELQVQVLETRKKKLGADHLDTLTSMANLASTCGNQGRWDAAEELEVQVMETRKKKLGADHPDTLTSIANLSVTYSMQGKQDKAEPLQVQVMETLKKKLGADHPDTLTSMANLAFTWKAQSRSREAIALMRQCLERRLRVLKPGHPHIMSSVKVLEQWMSSEEI
ncbi:TPR-like protein [Pyrenochaeta sp. DS3sAY3a]|nr:TPR-like protein [Pyrenochaeta sp. DS3sAY3a]